MKDLKESILNRENIISRGVEAANAETLCKLLFDFINKQKFRFIDVEPVKDDTNLGTYTFVKKNLRKNITSDLSNQTTKLFTDQNIKYKYDFQDYTEQYIINIEPKNLSYPNINIVYYRFKTKTLKYTYDIYVNIVAPKEYKEYI